MEMKRTLLLLAVLCVHTFAMVPNNRFTREATQKICAPHTPCSWDVYRLPSKEVYMTVNNTYCVCEVDQLCLRDEEDITASTFVNKCKAMDT